MSALAPSAVRVHELFERQAARTPDAVAVVCGDRRTSYRELDEHANQVARCLQEHAATPGELVGVALGRSPLMLAALLGAWKAGCAYVPLDPAYPRERLAFMMRDAGLRWILTDERCRGAFEGDGEARPGILSLDAAPSPLRDAAPTAPAVRGVPPDLAYVMYTSGSTGRPKGAMITHAGLANYLQWAVEVYGVQAGGSVPVHSSLSFDLTVTSLYVPLLAGAHVELLSEEDGAQSLLAALRAKPRSLVKLTPAHLELLNHELRAEELAGMAGTFVIGGEQLTAERLTAWRRHAPATRLINEYGPTETVVGCAIYEVAPGDPSSGAVPIGRAIRNMQLYVLDETLRPVPAGVAGELYVGGPGVARGYLNRPRLTAERFVADPFSDEPGARLYRTGDRVRRRAGADGVLEYLGRLDDQVKIRGHRVEPGEIEQTLAAHPAVRACAALCRPDAAGDNALAAFAVLRRDVAAEAVDLSGFLRERLPAWMQPSRIALLDAMPLDPNGKIDRTALREMAAAPRLPSGTGAAPRTATERSTLDAFQEAFERADIGVFDNFFEIGGHSLTAVRLMARLRSVTGVGLPLRNLYEHPTAAELAEVIDALRWSVDSRDAQPERGGDARTRATF